jgi:Lar family restriction alleviation protein
MSNENLLFCPFCGSEAELVDFDTMNCFVECRKCRASQPALYNKVDSQSAIAAWNRRQVDDASVSVPSEAVIELLKALVEKFTNEANMNATIPDIEQEKHVYFRDLGREAKAWLAQQRTQKGSHDE